MRQTHTGQLHSQSIAVQAVGLLRPVCECIQRRDKSLADQLRRAASSVVLNLAEAAYNNAGHRRSRLESARGSANEVRAALQLAVAWGIVTQEQAAPIDALYDRVLAMTYRLWLRA